VIQQTVAVKEEQSAAPSRHCSFRRKLFIFKSLNRVAGEGRRQVNPAAPGQPGRQPGLAAGAPRSSLTGLPRNIPAAHDLDRRPITRFRSTTPVASAEAPAFGHLGDHRPRPCHPDASGRM